MENEEIEKLIAERQQAKEEQTKNELVEVKKKSINEISLSDVKVTLNSNQDYNQQVKDVVGAMSKADAIKDENTNVRENLKTLAGQELLGEAQAQMKEAQKKVVQAETEVQKAEREAYEGVLETFGFFKHLPHWLTKIIVTALTPFFILIGFVVGIPCGFIKIVIDNIDGIIVRYKKSDDYSKPKIKVSIWILLALAVVCVICLTVLKCLGKI